MTALRMAGNCLVARTNWQVRKIRGSHILEEIILKIKKMSTIFNINYTQFPICISQLHSNSTIVFAGFLIVPESCRVLEESCLPRSSKSLSLGYLTPYFLFSTTEAVDEVWVPSVSSSSAGVAGVESIPEFSVEDSVELSVELSVDSEEDSEEDSPVV